MSDIYLIARQIQCLCGMDEYADPASFSGTTDVIVSLLRRDMGDVHKLQSEINILKSNHDFLAKDVDQKQTDIDKLKAELDAQEKKCERYLQSLRDDWKADTTEIEAHRDLWKQRCEKLAETLERIANENDDCGVGGVVFLAKEALASLPRGEKEKG